MPRFVDTLTRTRSALILGIILVALSGLMMTGCKSKDTPNTEKRGAVEATGTVQAELPTVTPDATASADATAVSGSGTTTASASSTKTATAAKPTAKPKPVTPAIWPARVAKYASAVKIPVWYPKAVPAGYKVNSVDVVELDKGSGLVCDMVFLKGDKALLFTQGSPKNRSYEIVSVGRVPWGTETADIVRQDPADPASPVMIVFSRGGNFAELQGDLSLAELKAVARSMVPVK